MLELCLAVSTPPPVLLAGDKQRLEGLDRELAPKADGKESTGTEIACFVTKNQSNDSLSSLRSERSWNFVTLWMGGLK